ncbi:MAG: Hsp33 family molecular chaperone HslO [Bacteroidota bacterium]
MITKEDFKFKDRMIKGITEDGHFRVSVVKTTDVVKSARSRHNLSLLNTVLLGRALTGTMLMASELKGEERIQLRLEGKGPVKLVIAEANRVGEIRGYVARPQAQLDYSEGEPSLSEGLGVGMLTVRKTLYNEADPRTSVIELRKSNVTDDLAYYMVQSEQIPSAILLHVGLDEDGQITEAGGVLVQKMPDAPQERIDQLQEHLKEFPRIDELLSNGVYIDEIMEQAVAPYPVKELDRTPVHFFCRCSRERFIDALAMLNYDELQEMKDEGQELVCHFCGEKYHVSSDELEEIAQHVQAKMN